MQYLTLIRHAKSDWSNHGADHDRPLNPRGRRDAAQMGRLLSAVLPAPQCILASTAERVQETLIRIRDAWPEATFPAWESMEALYLPEAETVWDHAQLALQRHAEVWIVAHNPGISETVALCTGTQLRDMPTLGVARIGFNPERIEPGLGSLLLFSCPKALKSDG